MTAREDRVLAVAREVWRKSVPSNERTEMAAQRIARRMRIASGRTQRRPLAILAFALVLIGALAYAASGGFSSGSGSRRQVQRQATERVGQAQPTPPVQKEARGRPVSEKETPALPAPSSDRAVAKVAPSSATKAKKSEIDSAAAAASSWREVDEALDAKDDKRAEKALGGLAGSQFPATRAKAKLGLAQLARSKNDCDRAKTLAREVIDTPDVDPAVVKRAQAIINACK